MNDSSGKKLVDERERRLVRGAPDLELPVALDPDIIIDRNMIVSAGAGSGKTQALVERIISLIRSGIAPDAIVAITYTKKAAGELKTRCFKELLASRDRIRERVRTSEAEVVKHWKTELIHVEAAVNRSEELFIGTIHSFCSRILRTFSFRVGISRDFTHLDEEDEIRLRRRFWNEVMDVDADADPDLRVLVRAGVSNAALFELFGTLVRNSSVVFEASGTSMPAVENAFDQLMDHCERLIPWLPDDSAPYKFELFLRELSSRMEGRREYDEFEMAFWLRRASLTLKKGKGGEGELHVKVKKWQPPGEEKQFGNRLKTGQESIDGPSFLDMVLNQIVPVMDEWQHWINDRALSFVGKSVESYRIMRMEAGTLTFDDMLMEASRLMFDSPSSRVLLREKISHILVDEFQDTDPEQAAMLFAYASEEISRQSWTEAALLPGRLTLVGDEKQSIYRFRKADFQAFEEVWRAFELGGDECVHFSTNFRSDERICSWVNSALRESFGQCSRPYQATWTDLEPHQSNLGATAPIKGLSFSKTRRVKNREEAEARAVADWIIDVKRNEDQTARYSDFLVLVRRHKNLSKTLRELTRRGIPASLSGGNAVDLTDVLQTVDDLLRCVHDPQDHVSLIATLRGPLFGVSDQELLDFRQENGKWSDLVELERFSEEWKSHDALVLASGVLQRVAHISRTDTPYTALEKILGLSGYASGLGSRDDAALCIGMLEKILSLFSKWEGMGMTLAECLFLLGRYRRKELDLHLFSEALATGDCVRLMTVHSAKGLQAPYVMLSDSGATGGGNTTLHVYRDGAVIKGNVLLTPGQYARNEEIFKPAGWNQAEEKENRYKEAEDLRLAYVACTRAEKQLIVSVTKEGKGVWDFLTSALEMCEWPLAPVSTEPELPGGGTSSARAAHERAAPGLSLQEINERKQVSAVSTWTMNRPSLSDESQPAQDVEFTVSVNLGREYGSAIHKLFEAVVARRKGSPPLKDIEELSMAIVGSRFPEPEKTDLTDLAQETISTFLNSEMWSCLASADRVLTEVPFTTNQLIDGMDEVTSGVVDLAFYGSDKWTIVDYKSDDGDEETLLSRHADQIRSYVQAWKILFPAELCMGYIWSTRLGRPILVEST